MTGKDLKNSILQLAIQGKLVPQNPNDEPASELLARIRQEKERLVKEKKLKKKDLETTPITDEEKPFGIPESWEWCRLGDIGVFERGNGIKRDETINEGFPCVRYGEMYTKYRYSPTFEKTVSFTTKSVFDKCKKAHRGDLFMALTGENKQDIALAAQYVGDEEIAVGGDLCHFTVLDSLPLFFVYLINSPYFCSIKEVLATGDIIVHISADKLGAIPIPLPPLAEQQRIVAKIEELMPLVEEYDKNEQKLAALNKALPEQLRQSVLQQAIMGRLVPQDDNDEPASELLARIRQEKERLVKEKKLKKKDLETTPITDEEKPFEIPESWEWCRLGEICKFLSRGKSPKYADTPNQYPVFAQKCNLKDGGISLEQARFLDPKTIDKWQEELKLKTDDILVNSTGTGTVCRTRLFHEKYLKEYPFTLPDSHVSVIRTFEDIDSAFYFFIFNSKHIQDYWEDHLAGSTNQKELYIGTLHNTIIPLPPLAEQQRIVAKIEELFSVIDNLKTC